MNVERTADKALEKQAVGRCFRIPGALLHLLLRRGLWPTQTRLETRDATLLL